MAPAPESRHRKLEGKSGLFALLTTGVILIGGIVEIAPILSVPGASTAEALGLDPYSPMELAGRDIYVREGCYNCHSQMVRPMRSDTLRYGTWSRSQEYVFDRPFQFGSKRIGPDLAREGSREPGQMGDTGGRNDAWHWEHLGNPRRASGGSPMPAYGWLLEDRLDPEDVAASMQAMQTLGVPYSDADIANVAQTLRHEGEAMVARLATAQIEAEWDIEAIALISYLQSLGRNRPLHDDLDGVYLGQALYDALSCGRCHGRAAEGGVPNPNADPAVMSPLNDMARRLNLADRAQAGLASTWLTEGADLEALRAQPPFPNYEDFLAALAKQRDAIRHGRVLAPVDPAQARPQEMPNYGGRLTERRVDAILAFLVGMQRWDPAPEVVP